MKNVHNSQFLRKVRNDIPIANLISDVLEIPYKYSEGYFRFICPICNEFHTSVKFETNLARCFRCKKNFNPIDIVMTVNNLSFINTIKFLEPFLHNNLLSMLTEKDK